MLDQVKAALKNLHISGMSVCDVKGFGRDKDEIVPGQFQSEFVDLVPKVKIEILCRDEDVEKIMDCIYQYAHTGLKGDGVTSLLKMY